jgi:hypothetical protein
MTPRNAGIFCSGSRGDAKVVTMANSDPSKVDVEEVKAEWKLLWK